MLNMCPRSIHQKALNLKDVNIIEDIFEKCLACVLGASKKCWCPTPVSAWSMQGWCHDRSTCTTYCLAVADLMYIQYDVTLMIIIVYKCQVRDQIRGLLRLL